MKRLSPNNIGKSLSAMFLMSAMLLPSIAIFGQTKVTMPKNKNSINKDIELGSKTAAQVERTFPMINDMASEAYINEVGQRLANAIPPEFQQRQFNCRFKIVNARDINAFALPACYLYVNRGMIEAAKNEGEMAGVMAHEISHAMLRHGTAAGPGILTQIGAIGVLLGGAVVGAPELGQIAAAGLITPYSRKAEKEADIVGANIMARAGYDPRDLASMFRTIAGEGGGQRAPEWVSSHPDPGNRYTYINQEAGMLRVSSNPIKMTQGFQRVQQYLRSLPRAQTMEEIEKGAQSGQGQNQPSPTANGRYERSVPRPNATSRTYNSGGLSLNFPNNWRDFAEQTQITIAPDGAYGSNGITHGALIGVERGNGGTLNQEMDTYVRGIMQANNYLQTRSNYGSTTLNGRRGLAIVLGGRSPITGRNEIATVYGSQTSNGSLFYVITVVPEDEATIYNNTFRNIVRSVRLNDR